MKYVLVFLLGALCALGLVLPAAVMADGDGAVEAPGSVEAPFWTTSTAPVTTRTRTRPGRGAILTTVPGADGRSVLRVVWPSGKVTTLLEEPQ
jgi:hypothetical protein